MFPTLTLIEDKDIFKMNILLIFHIKTLNTWIYMNHTEQKSKSVFSWKNAGMGVDTGSDN